MDKFIFEYQILRERLSVFEAAQKDMELKMKEKLKNNPDLFKLSEEQLTQLLKVGELFMGDVQEAVDKQIKARVKKKK